MQHIRTCILIFIIAVCSRTPAQHRLLTEWGNDILKHDVYGIKMGMDDSRVRRVLHARDDKPLLPEKVLRRAYEEYVELDHPLEYSEKTADEFFEDGYISVPSNVTPRLSYIARYRNEIDENYPLQEPRNELPQIRHTIYYHDFRITTNGIHKSLPYLEQVEKAQMKVMFNKDRRVVAIQMIFNSINEEDKDDVYDTLEEKYSKEIQSDANVLKYLISRNLKLYTSYGTKTVTYKGDRTRQEYTITNFYYHTTKFPQALKNKMIEEPSFDSLL
jgi:hypothetical protein